MRKNYPDVTLADLYDELSIPKDLRDAHKKMTARLPLHTVLKIFGRTNQKITVELLKMYNQHSQEE